MKDKGKFLAGLAIGAACGLLVQRERRARAQHMPYLDVGQQVAAEKWGQVKAAQLAGRARARYEELYAQRPHFAHPVLRGPLESNILPVLALYQVLREEMGDPEVALAGMDRIFAALVRRSGRRQVLRIMGHLPAPFALLRIGNRIAMRVSYPREGWTFEWVEDSSQCVAYNARDCFYLNVLTAYGAPELTAHFCKGDDLLFGDIPGISW